MSIKITHSSNHKKKALKSLKDGDVFSLQNKDILQIKMNWSRVEGRVYSFNLFTYSVTWLHEDEMVTVYDAELILKEKQGDYYY